MRATPFSYANPHSLMLHGDVEADPTAFLRYMGPNTKDLMRTDNDEMLVLLVASSPLMQLLKNLVSDCIVIAAQGGGPRAAAVSKVNVLSEVFFSGIWNSAFGKLEAHNNASHEESFIRFLPQQFSFIKSKAVHGDIFRTIIKVDLHVLGEYRQSTTDSITHACG